MIIEVLDHKLDAAFWSPDRGGLGSAGNDDKVTPHGCATYSQRLARDQTLSSEYRVSSFTVYLLIGDLPVHASTMR